LLALGAIAALALLAATSRAAAAQPAAAPETPAAMIAAQQSAMARLKALDGLWRGTGEMIDRPGETPRHMAYTLRVGPFLDGTVKLIEIRGTLADGSLGFHAFNTIYFDAGKGEYRISARAGGRSGDFAFRSTDDGYAWEIGPTGNGLRYTAHVHDGMWTEVGEVLAPGHEPVHLSSNEVRRIGSTDWPEAGAVPAR
jgi:hypothetical protein